MPRAAPDARQTTRFATLPARSWLPFAPLATLDPSWRWVCGTIDGDGGAVLPVVHCYVTEPSARAQ
jgi:hypothetical protein